MIFQAGRVHLPSRFTAFLNSPVDAVSPYATPALKIIIGRLKEDPEIPERSCWLQFCALRP
jgi:hypothetical protein